MINSEKNQSRVVFSDASKTRAVVTGATGLKYNVNLVTNTCPCNQCETTYNSLGYVCHHLGAAALADGKGIDSIFPEEDKTKAYKEVAITAGQFPSVPTRDKIKKLRDCTMVVCVCLF